MIRATKVQIENLKESLVWQDIIEEITKWKDNASQEPDAIVAEAEEKNPSTATVLMRLGHAAGIKNAVMYFEGILDLLLSSKGSEKDDSEC
jgi:hypothetical protein